MASGRIVHWLEIGAMVIALGVLGGLHYAKLSPEQVRYIALEAGLEQLYLLEQAHFETDGRYFDPTDPSEGLEWPWMDEYDWEVRIGLETFWFVVRADLDGDGRVGAWALDQQGPQMRNLMDD